MGAIALLTACGSSGGKPSKTVVHTVVQTVSASQSAPVSDAAPPSADTPVESAPVSEGAAPSASGIVPPSRSGQALTIDDFFQPDDSWSESLVNIANKSGVQGIEGGLDCFSTTNLELRLNDSFSSLTFNTAEENTSDSSTTTMVVSISVNGRQVAAKQNRFNSIQSFAINVAAANAVIISFSEQRGSECGEVKPVLFNAIVK